MAISLPKIKGPKIKVPKVNLVPKKVQQDINKAKKNLQKVQSNLKVSVSKGDAKRIASFKKQVAKAQSKLASTVSAAKKVAPAAAVAAVVAAPVSTPAPKTPAATVTTSAPEAVKTTVNQEVAVSKAADKVLVKSLGKKGISHPLVSNTMGEDDELMGRGIPRFMPKRRRYGPGMRGEYDEMMGFDLNSMVADLKKQVNTELAKAKEKLTTDVKARAGELVATTANKILANPQIQQAMVEKGKEATVQNIAQNIAQQITEKSAQTIETVKKYSIPMAVGGGVLGLWVLYKFFKR